MKDERKKEEMIQSLTIIFSDGTAGHFTGPAVLFGDEVKMVKEVTFHPPRPLPSDCHWSNL
jgi:hypothetical protein